MMNKFLITIYLLSLLLCTTNGQQLSRKWELVVNLKDSDVFLDTSNIKQNADILTAIILTVYKQPTLIPSIDKEVIYIKSQALFNLSSKRMSIIGNLYYDKNMKVVGENSILTPLIEGKNALPIDSNSVYNAVFNKCLAHLKIDIEKISKKEQIKNYNEFESLEVAKVDSNDFIKKNNVKSSVSIKHNEFGVRINQEELNKNEYDFSSEKNIYGVIFSDGHLYCFQVSSWKNKIKAETEVKRLKTLGHNAFYVKAVIPGKGIWYRVRIGFFSTLEEAESYINSLRGKIF